MKMVEFSEFLQDRLDSIKSVLDSKSADYSYEDDKLFNFKLAAKVGGVTPIEALRGMQLKHKTSLRQGLDELKEKGTLRSWHWWQEKATDDINYTILLLALIYEKELHYEKEKEKEKDHECGPGCLCSH